MECADKSILPLERTVTTIRNFNVGYDEKLKHTVGHGKEG
jgi:hypothetical protein